MYMLQKMKLTQHILQYRFVAVIYVYNGIVCALLAPSSI